jgi:hypothetical protein
MNVSDFTIPDFRRHVTVLTYILKELGMKIWSGFFWLKMGSSSRIL